MTQPFVAVPAGQAAFSTALDCASAEITAAGSADSAAMVSAVAAALGPIGAPYLAAFGPAQANNLAGALRVAALHAAISATTDGCRTSIIAADNA
jgi:hypothetical protein